MANRREEYNDSNGRGSTGKAQESAPVKSKTSKISFEFLERFFSPNRSRQSQGAGGEEKNAGRFTLAMSAIVIILIVALSAITRQEIDRMLLTEKLIEKRFEIALVAEQIDSHIEDTGDWAEEYERYLNTVLISIEMLDKVDMTYAAVFDEQLQNLSARSPSYEGSPFEPTEYPEFIEAVHSSESGDLTMLFTPPGAQTRPMYLHYRWLPSDAALPNRILLVTAISRFSINARISVWVQITTIVLMTLAFLMTLFVWRKQIAEFFGRLFGKKPKQQTEESDKRRVAIESSHFFDEMSRKLQTSLTVIAQQAATVQQDSSETSKAYSAGKHISEAASELLEIPNDMNYIAKIEKGTLALTIAPFSLKALLEGLVKTAEAQAKEKQLDWVTNVEQLPDWMLNGDEIHLQRILSNLLSNAVKYSNPGGQVRFRVDCKTPPEQKMARLIFTIVDEGIGIADAQLDKMYATFKQSNAVVVSDFEEVGIGLSVSYALTVLMGGSLSVQSEQGKGSVFALTVALERVQ